MPVLPPPTGVRRIRLNGEDQPVISILVAETCLANVTGAPALSVPLASADCPAVSLQILAPRNRDNPNVVLLTPGLSQHLLVVYPVVLVDSGVTGRSIVYLLLHMQLKR